MRVFIADEQPQVRRALRLLLEEKTTFTIVGEAIEADDLLAEASVASPDLLLLDWELSDLSNTELLPTLRDLCPDLIVVALSSRPGSCRAALAAGADAFVSKGDPPEKLLAVVEELQRIKAEG